MTVEAWVGVLVPSAANLREHWAKKARRVKRERTAARLAMNAHTRPADGMPVVVTLTRCGGRKLDDDNLRSALKATRDGVADWLRRDDGDDSIEWRYGQQTGGAKGTRIVVETR